MRTVAIGAVVALCALTACKDKVKAEPRGPADPPGAVNWSHGGPYAGIAVGYSSSVLQADVVDLGATGAFGGAYIGFGGIVGGAYLGIEGDAMAKDVKGRMSEGQATLTASTGYLASVRARVGLPIGHTLAYVTAGPAWTDSKLKASEGSYSIEAKDTLLGLALGAGIEAYITPTMHIRLEGIRYAFPERSMSFGSADTVKLGQEETVIRVGVGFKLN